MIRHICVETCYQDFVLFSEHEDFVGGYLEDERMLFTQLQENSIMRFYPVRKNCQFPTRPYKNLLYKTE